MLWRLSVMMVLIVNKEITIVTFYLICESVSRFSFVCFQKTFINNDNSKGTKVVNKTNTKYFYHRPPENHKGQCN